MSKEHPFMHAYPIENGNTLDAKAVDSVIDFVRQSTGTTSVARPKVWVVGHEHMQREARKVPHYKTIMTTKKREVVYKIMANCSVKEVSDALIKAHENGVLVAGSSVLALEQFLRNL